MRQYNYVAALIFPLSVLVLVGCQSKMQVTVQRIEPNGTIDATERVYPPKDIDIVESTVSALLAYQSMLLDVERELGSGILADLKVADLDSLEARINEGIALTGSLHAMEKNLAGARSTQYLLGASSTIQQGISALKELQKDAVNATKSQRETLGRILALQVPEARGGLRAALAKKTGYGGIARTGVTKLSEGDPNYKAVLEGQPAGEPITEVVAQATGDSTLIFVQESPTQMRVYSVDMSAEQIVENVGKISSKAVNAVLKFSAPAPVP